MKTVGAAEFKARCLRLIKQMNRDGEKAPLLTADRRILAYSAAGHVRAADICQ